MIVIKFGLGIFGKCPGVNDVAAIAFVTARRDFVEQGDSQVK